MWYIVLLQRWPDITSKREACESSLKILAPTWKTDEPLKFASILQIVCFCVAIYKTAGIHSFLSTKELVSHRLIDRPEASGGSLFLST